MANTPINVSELKSGDVVRIQLSAGNIVMPVGYGIAAVQRNQISLPYRRSSLVGFVIINDFQNRRLNVDFTDLTHLTEHYALTVLYKQIRVIEKQLEGSLISDNVHRLRIPAYVSVLGVY